MKRDRNHEGYHDPTAGRAIRRVSRRYKIQPKQGGLVYCLGDLPAFRKAVGMLKQ